MKSSEKPKKKRFSFFCCFATNDGGRRRRKKKDNQQTLESKQSITEDKISGFSNDVNSNKFSKQSEDKTKIIYDINGDIKADQKEDIKSSSNFLNINKTNNSIKIYDRNDKKEVKNKLNKVKLNNTISDNKTNLKISLITNSNIVNNSLCESKDKLNISSIKNKNNYKNIINRKGIIPKEEELSNQENNENIIINQIQIENYQRNDIELDNKKDINKEFQKNNEKITLFSQDNINIYDNNNNNNHNHIQNLKQKGKEKIKSYKFKDNNFNVKLNLPLDKSRLKKDNFNNEIKNNKNDSMIINNNKYSNLNLNNSSINSFISSPISKYKVNISIIKNNKEEKEKENFQNKAKTKIITRKSCFLYSSNFLKSFPYVLKKSKQCHSVILAKSINIENIKLFFPSKLNILPSNNHKNYRKRNNTNALNDNLNNKIKNNTTFIDQKAIKVSKKSFITFSPKESIKQNKVIINKKYNKLPLTTIGKKLYNINNNNKTFINNSQNNEIFYNFPKNLREKSNNDVSKEPYNKSLIEKSVNSNKIIANIKNNIETKKKKSNDIRDFEAEIEDEEESENKIINDSKSIISNYISSPLLNNQDMQSCAISLFSKNEYKDNYSNININDITVNTINKEKFMLPLGGLNEEELEITNENEKEIKSFIETPRTSGIYNKRFMHKNITYNSSNKNNNNNIYAKSINFFCKNINDKINNKNIEINKINDKINEIDKKIKTMDEINKRYLLWIEKEEEESEILINMINFLSNNKQ